MLYGTIPHQFNG